MKFFSVLLLCTVSVFAYHTGDTLSSKMTHTLDMKKDKLYIIDFFASWCGSCKKELPLIKTFAEHSSGKNVEVLGVDVDTNLDNAFMFQKELDLNFRVINDTNNIIISEFKALGMPSLYVLKNGKVLDVIVGAVADIEDKLQSIVQRF